MAKKPTETPEPAEVKNSAEPLTLPKPLIKAEVVPVKKPSVSSEDHKAPTPTAKELYQSLSTSSDDSRMYRLLEMSRSNKDVEWLLSEFNKSKNQS